MDMGSAIGVLALALVLSMIIVANAIQDIARAIERYTDALRKRQ